MTNTPDNNPYVGPRSFRRGERLYGRATETQQLINVLTAERLVLLHSPSGAGKSSLIQAALFKRLERKFRVLPVARVNLEPEPMLTAQAGFNRYAFSVLSAWEEDRPADQLYPPEQLAALSLSQYLDANLSADKSFTMLIFDQFEEILTLQPVDQAAKKVFFGQLGAALEDRGRWALFAMREDYVAALEPYLSYVPTRLSTRFRLDFLDTTAAREAMQKPAEQFDVRFTDEAATQLVDDLSRTQVQNPDGSTKTQAGLYVEPVQLQVVCQRLWAQLPPNITQITSEHLTHSGSVDEALAGYYAENVNRIYLEKKVAARAIRDWIENQLITPQGARNQVRKGEGDTHGLPNDVIDALINTYLVREETRRGAAWYELAHDRLLEPVLKNNRQWREQNLPEWQRKAQLWEKSAQPEGLLLRGEALKEAEAAVAKEMSLNKKSELFTGFELAFVAASRKAEKETARQREAARNRAIAVLGIFSLGLAVLMLLLWLRASASAQQANASAAQAGQARGTSQANEVIAQAQEATAKAAVTQAVGARTTSEAAVTQAVEAQTTAEAASQQALDEAKRRAESEAQFRRAFSQALAAHAQNYLLSDLNLALLLSVEANTVTETMEATNVLSQAIQLGSARTVEVENVTVLPAEKGNIINSLAFSPDGTKLVSVAGQQIQTVWDVTDPSIPEKLWTKNIDDPAALIEDAVFLTPDKIAFSDDIGSVFFRDAQTGVSLMTLAKEGDAPSISLALSPDGASLAAGRTDGKIVVWDWATGRRNETLSGHQGFVWALDFTSDGHYLVSGGQDRTVRIWALSSGQSILELAGQHADAVRGVVWLRDLIWLASASNDGTIVIWNQIAKTGNVLEAIGASVYSLALSPDRSVLAVGDGSGTTTFYDVRDPAAPVLITRSQQHSFRVGALAFSSQDGLVASGDSNGLIVLQRVTVQLTLGDLPLVEQACRLAKRNFSQSEWATFFPGQPYHQTCRNLPVP